MSLTTRDMEHARKRVADMTPSQLLTRLNRITKPEKLHAFSAAVAEQLEACKSEREVSRYHFILERVDKRRSSDTLDLDYYLTKFRVAQFTARSVAYKQQLQKLNNKVKTAIGEQPVIQQPVIQQPVIQQPKIKKKVSRRNLGI